MSAWLYILRCRDGSYYTGSSPIPEARLVEHQAGMGGDFTSRRLPVALVYSEEFATLREAFEAERRVKGWRREKKEALIRGDFESLRRLADTRRRP